MKEQTVDELMQPSLYHIDGKRQEQVSMQDTSTQAEVVPERGGGGLGGRGGWLWETVAIHRDATTCTFFTTAGRSTQRSCFVASFRDKQPRGAGDFFFLLFFLSALLCKQRLYSYQAITMPWLLTNTVGCVIASKNVSRRPPLWHKSSKLPRPSGTHADHVTTASAWRIKAAAEWLKRSTMQIMWIVLASEVHLFVFFPQWLNLQKLDCLIRADFKETKLQWWDWS